LLVGRRIRRREEQMSLPVVLEYAPGKALHLLDDHEQARPRVERVEQAEGVCGSPVRGDQAQAFGGEVKDVAEFLPAGRPGRESADRPAPDEGVEARINPGWIRQRYRRAG